MNVNAILIQWTLKLLMSHSEVATWPDPLVPCKMMHDKCDASLVWLDYLENFEAFLFDRSVTKPCILLRLSLDWLRINGPIILVIHPGQCRSVSVFTLFFVGIVELRIYYLKHIQIGKVIYMSMLCGVV